MTALPDWSAPSRTELKRDTTDKALYQLNLARYNWEICGLGRAFANGGDQDGIRRAAPKRIQSADRTPSAGNYRATDLRKRRSLGGRPRRAGYRRRRSRQSPRR